MESYQGKNDFIALCYDNDDRAAAERIAEALNALRVRVWSNYRGCVLRKSSDAERFAVCRTVCILISAKWIKGKNNTDQLKGAVLMDKQTVLLFLDDTDLSANEETAALLNRSMRMIDCDPENPDECMQELLSMECVTDCIMAEDEEPDTKTTSLLDIFS